MKPFDIFGSHDLDLFEAKIPSRKEPKETDGNDVYENMFTHDGLVPTFRFSNHSKAGDAIQEVHDVGLRYKIHVDRRVGIIRWLSSVLRNRSKSMVRRISVAPLLEDRRTPLSIFCAYQQPIHIS